MGKKGRDGTILLRRGEWDGKEERGGEAGLALPNLKTKLRPWLNV